MLLCVCTCSKGDWYSHHISKILFILNPQENPVFPGLSFSALSCSASIIQTIFSFPVPMQYCVCKNSTCVSFFSGSTFKPLNPVKRLDKSKKRSRRTTIMGIPNQVQKELGMFSASSMNNQYCRHDVSYEVNMLMTVIHHPCSTAQKLHLPATCFYPAPEPQWTDCCQPTRGCYHSYC